MTPRPRRNSSAARRDAVDEFLDTSRALVGIAVYSINAAPVDITVTQYRLLAVVASSEALTVSDIATLLGVAQSNASRHCDRLQRLELVRRVRSPEDGRVVLVQATDSGHEIVDLVTELRRRELDKVLGSLTRPDQERITAALRDFNHAAAIAQEQPWLTAAW